MSDLESDTLEVLFEYLGSRKVLQYHTQSPISLCRKVEGELHKLGIVGVVAPELQANSADFILQRFNKKWNAFINVDTISQIIMGDKLTVVQKPVSPKVCWHGFASSFYIRWSDIGVFDVPLGGVEGSLML